MEIQQVKELMFKAFKEGQDTPAAGRDTIKLWIAVELNEYSESVQNSQNTRKERNK